MGYQTNKSTEIDFSNSQECANYLAGIADRLNLAATRVETAKAAALSGNLANMDGFLANAATPLGEGEAQFKTIRHERAHLGDRKFPDGHSQEEEWHSRPLDWNALPETPPSHFIVYNKHSGGVVLGTTSDWETCIADCDRNSQTLYDVSRIGGDVIHFTWRLAADRSGELIGSRTEKGQSKG